MSVPKKSRAVAGGQTWRVAELARLAGVSVRTLHHYDAIRLLVPSGRTESGYRLYAKHDLLRLQQILIGRELGLSLEEIRRSLDDPAFDLRRALAAQRTELARRRERAEAMLRAVDAALAALDAAGKDKEMSFEELFDGFDPAAHEAEASERWGKTDAWRESKRRTDRYTPEDWKRYQSEQAAVYDDFAAAHRAGTPVDDPGVALLVERHRRLIDQWFYPCSPAQQRGLAGLYESDGRFAANIDKHGEGLTAYVVAAIRRATTDDGGEVESAASE